MSEKIQGLHLARAAFVYVRQSSMQQVRHNLESQRRQYDLHHRARELGFEQVVVIDDDLGRSGSGLVERPGFARLAAAVCEAKVGAVLALEASRLARNNRDWHYLLELCTMTQTLVIDHDGIYDPRLLNDRLLLGLKGTMSEFELSLFRQRAHEALWAKAQRGEIVSIVPIGYVKTHDARIEMSPDLQIQEAIRAVFRKFHELGSVRQVLMWYRDEEIPLPCHESRSEVVWRIPSYSRIISILQNPAYAGAYAYGKTSPRTRFVDGRARKTRGHPVAREQWKVLIQDHHEGYITWDEYLSIEQTIACNTTQRGVVRTGAPRAGKALLSGLLRCGRCGRKLHVGYGGNRGQVGRYHCYEGNLNNGTPLCISVGALRLDRAVEQVVLEALRPEASAASLLAAEEALHTEGEKLKSLRLALEKARYEAERARRQYDAVDPENRLVASQLEERWNRQLQTVADLEARLACVSAQHAELTEEESQRIMQLGQQVETLWHHPQASPALKKRIVRTVIEEIVVDVIEGDCPRVTVIIHWKGGVHTRLEIEKNTTGRHGRTTDRDVVQLVTELAKVCPDKRIAWNLNRLGYRTATGLRWTERRARSVRSQYSIPPFDPARRSWLTMEEVARRLGVSTTFVRHLMQRNILHGEQAVMHAPWTIQAKDLESSEVICAVKAVKARAKGQHFSPGQKELF